MFRSTMILGAWLTAMPASANFFSYSQWERMGDGARSAYIAGAFDSLTTFAWDAQGLKAVQHYRECMNRARMSAGQLAENVRAFVSSRPAYQAGNVQAALTDYLIEACGRP